VDYLDIEGTADEGELFGVKQQIDFGRFQGFTTFGTEDEWPV